MKLRFDIYSYAKRRLYAKAGEEVTEVSSSPALPTGRVHIVERADGFRFSVHSDKLLLDESDLIEPIIVIEPAPEKKTRKPIVNAPLQQSLF